MKDRIKFNDAMLSVVMDGRKTQTRRPIDPQPKLNEEHLKQMGAIAEGFTLAQVVTRRGKQDSLMLIAHTVIQATSSTLQTRTVISKGKLKLLMFGFSK